MAILLSGADAGILAAQGRGNLKPRLKVFVGPGGMTRVGNEPTIQVTFPISANCIRSNFFSADRFKIVCSLYADPNQSLDFWAPNTEAPDNLGQGINVSVFIGFLDDPRGFVKVFRGYCDKTEFDLIRGTVTLSGRNFAGMIIDSQKTIVNKNRPIKDVIQDIATDHGMGDVDWGPEGPPVGDFGTLVGGDKADANLGSQSQDLTQIDTVARLGQFGGRAAYEFDGILHVRTTANGATWTCQAPTPLFAPEAPAIGQGHVTKLGPSNSIGLKFVHDYTFSSDTQVVAIHHKIHEAKTVAIKWPEDDAFADPNGIRKYYMELHSMEDADAEQMVKNYHNVINFREWLMEWKLVGPDLLLADVVDSVEVGGTNSYIDGLYGIASIEYDISFERGFVQIIKGVWGKLEGLG